MAIARNSSADLGLQLGGTSYTKSYTSGSGSNRILIVAFFTGNGDVITGVTYAGTSMTQVANVAGGSDRRIYLYYLLAPATGANNVVISASSDVSAYWAVAADYTGAAQSGQPDASATNTSAGATNLTATVNVVAANSWVMAVAREFSGIAGSWTNVTGVQEPSGSGLHFADSNADVGSGNDAVDFSTSPSLITTSIIAASFAPVGGGSSIKTVNGLAIASVKTINGLA